MPETDYSEMLGDILAQFEICVKKLTPILAKRVNVVATEIDGKIGCHIHGINLVMRTETARKIHSDVLEEIAFSHFPDAISIDAWRNEIYHFHACTIALENDVQVLLISNWKGIKHAT